MEERLIYRERKRCKYTGRPCSYALAVQRLLQSVLPADSLPHCRRDGRVLRNLIHEINLRSWGACVRQIRDLLKNSLTEM